jgi:hypothetical protein
MNEFEIVKIEVTSNSRPVIVGFGEQIGFEGNGVTRETPFAV